MGKLTEYHKSVKRKEDELRVDIIPIKLSDVPQPHFPELKLVIFTKQFFKSKRKNGNHKQGSKIRCYWVCECGDNATRDLSRFRKNRSLLCANCLRRNASSQMMVDRKEKYSKLGKKNWKLSIGVWVEENGNPMYYDNIKEKIKQTNLERYGVENTLQSAELTKHVNWKEHTRRGLEIKKEKGNHPSSPEVIAKFRRTMSDKSDEEMAAIKAARSKTWHENFDTPEKVKALLDKSLNIRPQKSTTRFGRILYQGQHEFAFVQECDSDERVASLRRGPVIPYVYKKEKRWYAIDYLISICNHTALIEVKSMFTYQRWLDKNLAKFASARDYADKHNMSFYTIISDKPQPAINEICNFLKLNQ